MSTHTTVPSRGICPHCSAAILTSQIKQVIPAPGNELCPACDGGLNPPPDGWCPNCKNRCVVAIGAPYLGAPAPQLAGDSEHHGHSHDEADARGTRQSWVEEHIGVALTGAAIIVVIVLLIFLFKS